MRRAYCWLAGIALAALLVATTPALAQANPPVAVAVAAEAVVVTLTCSGARARPELRLDYEPAQPLGLTSLGAAPPALALVIDLSAPMGLPGTPEHARLDDAVQLALTALVLLPADASLAVVVAAREARVVAPLATGSGAAAVALGKLAPAHGVDGAASPALAEGIALGVQQLDAAPPGPRAILVLTASPAATPLLGAAAAGTGGGPMPRMLLVGVGAGAATGAPTDPGVSYLGYTAATITALPALRRVSEAHLRALLTPGERLRLTLPPVGPGAHLLTVTGCGEPMSVAFTGPAGAPATLAWGALGLGAVGVAAGVWGRGRRPRGAPGPEGTTEARRLAAGAITTARRVAEPVGPVGLRAIIWDGRSRRSAALEGRHWLLGSDPGCTLVIEGPGIASLHARLSATAAGLTLTSLDAAGDTRLGLTERPLAPGVPAALAEGELVVLGQNVRLMVERASAGPEVEP